LISTSKLSSRSLKGLYWLLIVNVIATIFHYTDNVCRFEQYPEPMWLNPTIVDAFWFVMTPLALIGYRLMRKGELRRGALVLYAYATASLLVLGHYNYAPFLSISLTIHLFILAEAALAVTLVIYVATLQIRRIRIGAG
jgi:hypothetical protein